MLQYLVRARPLLWLLVKREFRARYAGSTLGMVWNIIHPIVLIGMYFLVFSRLMGEKLGAGGSSSYVVHLCAGIVPWLFFAEVLTRSTTALVDNASFLKKLVLPEEILYIGVLVHSLVTHFASIILLAIFLIFFKGPATAAPEMTKAVMFAAPVFLALGVLGVGIGMFLSVLHLLMRDIGQILAIGLQIVFWSLPIVYLPSILPAALRNIAEYNPLLPYISLIQRLFGSPDALFNNDGFYVVLIYPFLAVLIGLSFLKHNRTEILDRL